MVKMCEEGVGDVLVMGWRSLMVAVMMMMMIMVIVVIMMIHVRFITPTCCFIFISCSISELRE